MIDLEELKVQHAQLAHARSDSGFLILDFGTKLVAAFPAILAKLEAAQRLRETVAICLSVESPAMLREALAAFDKEQHET